MEARVLLNVAARLRLLAGVAVPAALWPAATLAASPLDMQCIDANEEAQDLRRDGRLLEAAARLAFCVAPSCPRLVREDCVERLRAVDDATPTLVLDATDDAGGDLPGLLVTLDDRPIPAVGSIPVDPGAHRFVFESDGHATKRMTLVAREGEKERHVRAMLAASAPSRKGNLQRPVALLIGGVGLAGLAVGGLFAALAKSTYSHALGGECGGDPNACSAAGESDGRSAQAQARVSTIALVSGGVLVATGAVLYLTAPGDVRVSLRPTVGAAGAGLSLRSPF
jgi:hypothetical protein